MHTLRLILEGVIFLTMTNVDGVDRLWLLLLDPGHSTAVHHHARLYIDPGFRDASSRDFDGTDHHSKPYFDLAGDHLTLSFPKPTSPNTIQFIEDTRPPGAEKPCNPAQCGASAFREQRNDVEWVNSLSNLLRNTPLKPGRTRPEATRLRDDIRQTTYSKDGLILARIEVPVGKVRTYTLWGEAGNETNTSLAHIDRFVFKEPWIRCQEEDVKTAVTEFVIVEIETEGALTLLSRSLEDGIANPARNIVTKELSSNTEIRLSSMRHNGATRQGDFSAFFELLAHPDYFYFLPLPHNCDDEGDSGGACSPANQ